MNQSYTMALLRPMLYISPTEPTHSPNPLPSSHLLPIHIHAVARRRSTQRRQPALGVLVVKRPRRHDDGECERGAGEAHVEREPDVLLREADEEGEDLDG